MTTELLIALIAFSFVGFVTPGPNNLMLMASGANFGIWRTLPHFFGITAGFVIMVMLVGLGLVELFLAYPASYELLRWLSVVYLAYLAWKIANARPGQAKTVSKPLTWLQAALFQWVNPKAWALSLSAMTAYAPSQNLSAVLLIATILGLINMPSIFIWIVAGSKLKRYLDNEVKLRVFNYSMALLLLATLYPVLIL